MKRAKKSSCGYQIEPYNEKYEDLQFDFASLTSNKDLKRALKNQKKNQESFKKKLLVIKFEGDIKASSGPDLDEFVKNQEDLDIR